MNQFDGKVAVITGAGSGFGLEFARLGGRLGMKLALADVQRNALDATVAELKGGGASVIGEVVDVMDDAQVRRLADRTYAEFGAAHLLFNNAGVGGGGGYLWESSVNDWQWALGVNLMGVVHGIRHFVPRMLAQRGEGHIVNTASMAGWLAPPLMAAYNASKHAVVALTETLYHDLRLAGSTLGVSVLCPAFVPTGIAQSERNRPTQFANAGELTASQRLAQQQAEKAVSSGKITAAEVAALTFEAIRTNRFYVYTHPKILAAVRARFDAALTDGPPADPFASNPATRPSAAA
jgi:NAD(P)-dependent dehydrogenase (short-subunit alcohol dehydrogenase family)